MVVDIGVVLVWLSNSCLFYFGVVVWLVVIWVVVIMLIFVLGF